VEKLQLRPTFPYKPLIKTYVTLWESCRSIAPLRLLFLEIFHLVGNFRSYGILKTESRIEFGRWCPRALLQCAARADAFWTSPTTWRPRIAPAYGQPWRLRGRPQTGCGPSAPSAYRTPRLGIGRPTWRHTSCDASAACLVRPRPGPAGWGVPYGVLASSASPCSPSVRSPARRRALAAPQQSAAGAISLPQSCKPPRPLSQRHDPLHLFPEARRSSRGRPLLA
jgi:hypothetical protein